MAFMMSHHALALIIVALGITPGVPSQAPATAPSTSQTPAQMPAASMENAPIVTQPDVTYGTVGGHPLLLDIYQPAASASGLRPAVILIHGGGWTSFDKTTMHGMATFLARSGFVAFSVDYRLMHGAENLWPIQLDDVQHAVRWIRANAAKYGVDPDHIGAFGHSSGAQLAALLGMEEARETSDPVLAKYSSKVQAVVDVDGPTDFTTHGDSDGDIFLTAFFGGDYVHHPAVWQDASPVFHVSRNSSPFLIVHGTHDEYVPITQAQELADKLKQAGVPVKFVKIDDVHTFQTPEARRLLAVETQAFFNQYLR
jgi:acetyl esterase/lipase